MTIGDDYDQKIHNHQGKDIFAHTKDVLRRVLIIQMMVQVRIKDMDKIWRLIRYFIFSLIII